MRWVMPCNRSFWHVNVLKNMRKVCSLFFFSYVPRPCLVPFSFSQYVSPHNPYWITREKQTTSSLHHIWFESERVHGWRSSQPFTSAFLESFFITHFDKRQTLYWWSISPWSFFMELLGTKDWEVVTDIGVLCMHLCTKGATEGSKWIILCVAF